MILIDLVLKGLIKPTTQRNEDYIDHLLGINCYSDGSSEVRSLRSSNHDAPNDSPERSK